ncbi:endospore germination permease [Clostridium brassicae]|uniref:Endospore germination permease n=1 Tax=Clostridium brassicae TaxID=2999072 RepID=A0ABT4DF53_9CLOT|nr:endospore germination permease [Clostridium brassicae]MCY6959731.1 endospore germination permease [Clostridium brassicae]
MNQLNSRHLIFVIFGISIVALKTYPNIVILFAGRDSWIAVLIASILLFLFTIYIILICQKTETYNIYEIYDFALGKKLSTILLSLLYLTIFLTLIECSSIESSSIHENLFIETPPWYILIFFVMVGFYSINKGLNAVIIITVIGISFIMLAGMNLGIMTIKFKDNKFLFPILENGFDLNFLIATIKALGGYSSIFLFLPFLINLDTKERKHLTKSVIIALIIVIQMEILSMTGIITTFGPKRAINIWYPKLIQTQLVGYFGFLESGEFFVLLQMVGGWFVKYLLTFYTLLTLSKEFNFLSKYTTLIVSILVYIISFFIIRNAFFLLKFLNYYNYISLINFIIIPFFVFTLFIVKFNKKQKRLF